MMVANLSLDQSILTTSANSTMIDKVKIVESDSESTDSLDSIPLMQLETSNSPKFTYLYISNFKILVKIKFLIKAFYG